MKPIHPVDVKTNALANDRIQAIALAMSTAIKTRRLGLVGNSPTEITQKHIHPVVVKTRELQRRQSKAWLDNLRESFGSDPTAKVVIIPHDPPQYFYVNNEK